jgi:hypothetical protein
MLVLCLKDAGCCKLNAVSLLQQEALKARQNKSQGRNYRTIGDGHVLTLSGRVAETNWMFEKLAYACLLCSLMTGSPTPLNPRLTGYADSSNRVRARKYQLEPAIRR